MEKNRHQDQCQGRTNNVTTPGPATNVDENKNRLLTIIWNFFF